MRARMIGNHIEIDEEEARSGQTGLHMRYILTCSTLLVALGIGLAVLLTPIAH
jgi:hypothetical protein